MTRSRKIRDAMIVALVTIMCALMLKTFVLEAFRIPSGSMENTLKVGDLVLVNKLAYGLRTPGIIPFTAVTLDPVTLLSLHDVRRGDIVVFESPMRATVAMPPDLIYFVKRCIGIPGDTVVIRNGRVFINGRELLTPETVIAPSYRAATHRPAAYPSNAGFTDIDYGPVRVPARGDVIHLDPAREEWWRPILERDGRTVDVFDNGVVRVDGWERTTYTLGSNYYFMLGDNRDNSADSRMWGFVSDREIVGEAMMIYWSTADHLAATDGSGIRWNRVGTLVR